MAPVVGWIFASTMALAAPTRGTILKPVLLAATPGRNPERLIVKLVENAGLIVHPGGLSPHPKAGNLTQLLQGSTTLFNRSPEKLRREKEQAGGDLADLSLYLTLTGPDAIARGNALLQHPLVETAYLAPNPSPPPSDIAPETPDFSAEQGFDQAGPEGLGFDIAHRWPGGDGSNVVIADVEYSFDPSHEEFEDLTISELGYPYDDYQFHGNGVLGILGAPHNDFGVSGLVPGADFIMVSPFNETPLLGVVYNVANAIDLAAEHLDAGDILLIEQQGWNNDVFTPVEISIAEFDAISHAVARGIVVIEPAGNGACDLDDPIWEGAFDRTERDSGAIMVGGGASPFSSQTARSYYHPSGSCFGSRVDVQGWYDHTTTTSAADGAPSYTDRFYPGYDGRQAYTGSFGGTSGAAPMIAAIAAAMNSVAIETRGVAWDPLALRAAMVSTGHPQQQEGLEHIGPQPDLRRLLRLWGVR
jgi:serine protease